jgi:hypothetical protein
MDRHRYIYSRFGSRTLARMGLEYMRNTGEISTFDRARTQRIDGVWCITCVR